MKPITSLFLLSALCLLLLLHVTLAADSDASSPSSQPGSAAAPSSGGGPNLLEEACKAAKNKDYCLTSLKKDPNSAKADLNGLAFIALRIAAGKAADLEEHLRSLLMRNATGVDPEAQQGVNDCVEGYTDANEQLDDSVAALQDKNYVNIVKWVRVALADAVYCGNSMNNVPNNTMVEKNKEFVNMCESVLSVMKAIAPTAGNAN